MPENNHVEDIQKKLCPYSIKILNAFKIKASQPHTTMVVGTKKIVCVCCWGGYLARGLGFVV
jgi:hypothetical protein